MRGNASNETLPVSSCKGRAKICQATGSFPRYLLILIALRDCGGHQSMHPLACQMHEPYVRRVAVENIVHLGMPPFLWQCCLMLSLTLKCSQGFIGIDREAIPGLAFHYKQTDGQPDTDNGQTNKGRER